MVYKILQNCPQRSSILFFFHCNPCLYDHQERYFLDILFTHILHTQNFTTKLQPYVHHGFAIMLGLLPPLFPRETFNSIRVNTTHILQSLWIRAFTAPRTAGTTFCSSYLLRQKSAIFLLHPMLIGNHHVILLPRQLTYLCHLCDTIHSH